MFEQCYKEEKSKIDEWKLIHEDRSSLTQKETVKSKIICDYQKLDQIQMVLWTIQFDQILE